MKKLCLTLLKTFIFSAAVTQLVSFVTDKMSFRLPAGSASLTILFSTLMVVTIVLELFKDRVPRFPSIKLERILEKEGYTAEFYQIAGEWRKKCEKKGKTRTPALVMSELLIDGGHYAEGFEELSKLEFKNLSYRQKQIYFNTALYGAVLCGDGALAEEIYECGRKYLISVTAKSLLGSVKHTLGCYEYLIGDVNRAEEFFKQSLNGADTRELKCEAYLGLSVCYLDTGRLEQAKKAVESAAEYAAGVPIKRKLSNAKKLVEQAFYAAKKKPEE